MINIFKLYKQFFLYYVIQYIKMIYIYIYEVIRILLLYFINIFLAFLFLTKNLIFYHKKNYFTK